MNSDDLPGESPLKKIVILLPGERLEDRDFHDYQFSADAIKQISDKLAAAFAAMPMSSVNIVHTEQLRAYHQSVGYEPLGEGMIFADIPLTLERLAEAVKAVVEAVPTPVDKKAVARQRSREDLKTKRRELHKSPRRPTYNPRR